MLKRIALWCLCAPLWAAGTTIYFVDVGHGNSTFVVALAGGCAVTAGGKHSDELYDAYVTARDKGQHIPVKAAIESR